MPLELKAFMLAGNATFTLQNDRTGNRFTYKVTQAKAKTEGAPMPAVWFVKVLTGPDNEACYEFVGTVFGGVTGSLSEGARPYFRHSGKSRIGEEAKSVEVFKWLLANIDALPPFITAHHEGRCGRCGRKLTVPESIESGFGPECGGRA